MTDKCSICNKETDKLKMRVFSNNYCFHFCSECYNKVLNLDITFLRNKLHNYSDLSEKEKLESLKENQSEIMKRLETMDSILNYLFQKANNPSEFYNLLEENGYDYEDLRKNPAFRKTLTTLYSLSGLMGFDFGDVVEQIRRNNKVEYEEEITIKNELKKLRVLNKKDVLFLIDVPLNSTLTGINTIIDIINKILPDSVITFQFYIDKRLKEKIRLKKLIFSKF